METDINDSTSAVISIKCVSTQCPSLFQEPQSCYGYCVEKDHKKAECAVTINEERYEESFVKYNTIKLDTFSAVTNVSNTGIAPNDINIKLDFGDDFLNFHNKKEPVEQDNALENHIETSIDRAKRYCDSNTKNFKRNSITKYTTLHGKDRYKCNICVRRCKTFYTRKVILKHMKLHFEKKYQGLIRAKIFQKKDTHTNEVNYKCDVCTKLFVTKGNLRRHMKKHIGVGSYKCEICDKCFASKQYMLAHIEKHTGERNYECDICNKCFTTKQDLLRHCKTHNTEKKYKCDICNKCFTTKLHLSRHFETHKTDQKYPCDICNKCFTRKQVLSRHLKTHTRERNCKCEICNKCFKTRDCLSTHLKIHKTRERKYKCETCNKCFTKKQHLSQHFETHNTERNYKCEICSKSFTTKQRLSRHFETHNTERNYKCEICNKCFTTKECLSKHIKTHTRERNHNCKKGNGWAEHERMQVEDKGKEEPLQNCPFIVPITTTEEISETIKPFIKKEIGTFQKKDTAEKSRSTGTNESIDAAIKERDAKSTNISNLWHRLHNEIVIKEEQLMDT